MPKLRKMLCDWNAPYIQSLIKLVETQSKITLVTWAVGYSERVILPLWSKHYPDDLRPQKALQAARDWVSGIIKLPQAKSAILECHAAAREASVNPSAQAAARTMGQCASTIHSVRHCMGLAFYGTIAVAYNQLGVNAAWRQVEQCAAEECAHMEAALREIAVEKEPNPVKIERRIIQ